MAGIRRGDLIRLPGEPEFVRVRNAVPAGPAGAVFAYVEDGDKAREVMLSAGELRRLEVLSADGLGRPGVVLAGLWAQWLSNSIGRLHPSVMTTAPLQAYAHQSEAVYARMMPQPRLRFLLADEPGTGKTIMAGLWLRESQRLGMIRRALVVCPAHLVSKWIDDVKRFLGAEMKRITADTASGNQLSWDPCDLWVVSMDLAAANPAVREALRPETAGWDAVVVDEAHRFTPTARTYYQLGKMLAIAAPQMLMLTATPHRGNEWLFRSLMHLVDPEVFPEPDSVTADQPVAPLKPGRVHFLRRMKEQLIDFGGEPLFRSRTARNEATPLNYAERRCYDSALHLVDEFFPAGSAALARMVYGKRASSSLHALRETLLRRMERAGSSNPRDAAHAADPYGDYAQDGVGDEAAVEAAASEDLRRERVGAAALAAEIDELLTGGGYSPSKWPRLLARCFEANGISPGSGEQAVVFTEYADTAAWLVGRLRLHGFSTEMYSGRQSHSDRDVVRTRFARREFEVLVSTDAGGEGIDLQTARVLVNWDIPWSLVRLEQRMGRIHRIGQTRDVHLYNLIATGTREGDAMARLLDNLVAAANELDGKMFDSLRLVAEMALSEAGVRSLQELLAACASGDGEKAAAIEKLTAERLRQIFEQQSAATESLATEVSLTEAEQALYADHDTRVNPEVVERFAAVCRDAGLISFAESAAADRGCYRIGPGSMRLPDSWREGLADGGTRLVATRADMGAAAPAAAQALMLGPSEPAAKELVDAVADCAASDMHRGALLWDSASDSDYTLFAYEMTVTEGRRDPYRHCFMVRVSDGGARGRVADSREPRARVADSRAGEHLPAADSRAGEHLPAADSREPRARVADWGSLADLAVSPPDQTGTGPPPPQAFRR